MTWELDKREGHHCEFPLVATLDCEGSIWRCDECLARWIIVSGERGPRWMPTWFQRKRKYRKTLR